MAEVFVHPRIHERYPELMDSDVLFAWENSIVHCQGLDVNTDTYVAIGINKHGLLIEMVTIASENGDCLIYHIMTPPTKKVLIKLGIQKEEVMNRKELNEKFGVTEEQLDARAEEYENDTWDATHLGKPVMGRPSIADEEVRPVTFRLPVSKIIALDDRADKNNRTRSDELRAIIDQYLATA